MRPEAVRQCLKQEEGKAKVILLADGTKLHLRSPEQWVVGGEYLYVLADDGYVYHVAYRNIAAVRYLPANGRKPKR